MTTTAIVFALSLSPAAYAHEEGKNMLQMEISPNVAQAPFDVQFLDTMSQHHRDGIKMMEMAVDKAQSPKIKSDAKKMMEDQQVEIDDMQTLKGKIQPDAAEAINMQLPGMMHMDMSKLEKNSGASFDHAYLHAMIKHHQGAVKMSNLALQKSQNPEVRAKAQMMHDMQKHEIADMKKMAKTLK